MKPSQLKQAGLLEAEPNDNMTPRGCNSVLDFFQSFHPYDDELEQYVLARGRERHDEARFVT